MSGFEDPQIYRTILETLKSGLYVVDRERRIVFWNDGAERITGYLRHEVVGHSCVENVLKHCNADKCELCGQRCPLTSALRDARPVEATGFIHHKGGHRLFVHLWPTPVRNQHGSVIGALQNFEGRYFVPNPDRRENTLGAYGLLDAVTGVANHVMMQSHLRETLATFSELNVPIGILCIQLGELDHFRHNYGQEAANSILRVVAQTIENSVRPTDFLGRWADDKFLAILVNCQVSALDSVRERIHQMLASGGIDWWGRELRIAVTVQETTAQSGDTIELLLERVEQAFRQISGAESAAAVRGAGTSSTS
jgi:diguanylate cyclase (GGDEF)-like protein/PAS domain S-box-containing protein